MPIDERKVRKQAKAIVTGSQTPEHRLAISGISGSGCGGTVAPPHRNIQAWALFGQVFRALFTRYAKITNTVLALLLVYCAISLFF